MDFNKLPIKQAPSTALMNHSKRNNLKQANLGSAKTYNDPPLL